MLDIFTKPEFLAGMIGVVLGALIPITYEAIKTYLAFRKRKTYTGIQLITALPKFVDDCANVAIDDGKENGQLVNERHCGQAPEPDLNLDFNHLDWTVLSKKMMHDILMLPSDLTKCKLYIQECAYREGHDYSDTFVERRLKFSQLGLHANKILVGLYRELGLVKKAAVIDFDSEETLRRSKENMDEVIQHLRNNKTVIPPILK